MYTDTGNPLTMHERQHCTLDVSHPFCPSFGMPHVLAAHVSGMCKPRTFSPSHVQPMSFAWVALCQCAKTGSCPGRALRGFWAARGKSLFGWRSEDGERECAFVFHPTASTEVACNQYSCTGSKYLSDRPRFIRCI